MFGRNDLLFGVVLPFLWSAGVTALPWPWLHGRGRRRGRTDALAIAGAFVIAFASLLRFRSFPPTDEIEKLAYSVLAFGLLGTTWSILHWPRMGVGLAVGVLTAVMMAWILEPILPRWSIEKSLAVLTAVGISSAIAALLLDELAQRNIGWSMPLCCWAWAASISPLLLLTGSLKMGQMAGALAAGLGGLSTISLFRKDFSMARGTMAVLVPLSAGLLCMGHIFADLKLTHALLTAAALPLAWVGELKFFRRQPNGLRTLLVLLVVLIPMACALLPAIRIFMRDSATH